MKNPLSIFRKAYNKLFRRAPRGLHTSDGIGLKLDDCQQITSHLKPDWFRKQFEEAYPDAAKFLTIIRALPNAKNTFFLSGSFIAGGFVSAEGLSTPYKELEDKRLEEVKKEEP